ncbi:MAG: LPP20 family lipoprotein [Nitrospirota bacterium]|nr:LPP20 family lipoprotein [Nitrospirota bacterium]
MILVGCYVVPVKETLPPKTEWVPITIRATGSGAPPPSAISPAQARLMAERAAKLDGYRNLIEQAYGVNITSTSTVRDFILQSDTIRARVEAFIKGAKVVDTRHLSDGSVEVEMELTLGYEFRQMFP